MSLVVTAVTRTRADDAVVVAVADGVVGRYSQQDVAAMLARFCLKWVEVADLYLVLVSRHGGLRPDDQVLIPIGVGELAVEIECRDECFRFPLLILWHVTLDQTYAELGARGVRPAQGT